MIIGGATDADVEQTKLYNGVVVGMQKWVVREKSKW
jgi:hypothetical protein